MSLMQGTARAGERRRHQMAHPWLNDQAATYFAAHAAARGVHRDVLLQQLLETIHRDDMVAAVLDD